MGFLRKSKTNTDKPPSEGPEDWARRAQEVSAEVKRQRASGQVGDTAVGSLHAEQQEVKMGDIDIGELSAEYLRFLASMGAKRGKFIRVGDAIFLSPAKIPNRSGEGLMHKEILERAMRAGGVKEKTLGAEAIQGATEDTIGPNGLVDAGKFDIFFIPEDEPRDDGLKGRFRTYGQSSSFGMASDEGRQKTVNIARLTLGPDMRVEDEPHMMFSH